jgi:hypothetical protein
MGYLPILNNQKTSLKKDCVLEECLASEFDNLFYNSDKVMIKNAGVLLFYKKFNSLQEAHSISDHIPIWAEIEVN